MYYMVRNTCHGISQPQCFSQFLPRVMAEGVNLVIEGFPLFRDKRQVMCVEESS